MSCDNHIISNTFGNYCTNFTSLQLKYFCKHNQIMLIFNVIGNLYLHFSYDVYSEARFLWYFLDSMEVKPSGIIKALSKQLSWLAFLYSSSYIHESITRELDCFSILLNLFTLVL